MPEPTRQQIKEAFKKTIERWERIAEDADYFNETECALCELGGKDGEYICSKLCPVRLYTNCGACGGTPYSTFYHDKTPANALAELNFLRKVYIWWVEQEEGVKLVDYLRKEKKEEWVDVGENVRWKFEPSMRLWRLSLHYQEKEIGFLAYGTLPKFCLYDGYKLERDDFYFRILKKV